MTEIDIAKVCHSAHVAYLKSLGADYKEWEQADHEIRLCLIATVRFRIMTPRASISTQHSVWVADKVAAGWQYGETIDPIKKTHPYICAYEQLPVQERVKDLLTTSIIQVLKIYIKHDT